MASDDLIHSSATALVARLAKGEITPLDLLDALEPRIAEVDPQVNALPTLCFERARDHAKRLMAKPVSERGLLQGMPVAIKDLSNVAGVRSTQGSPNFVDPKAQTFRRALGVVACREGYYYTMMITAPERLWDECEAGFKASVQSFRLDAPTDEFRAPDTPSLQFW